MGAPKFHFSFEDHDPVQLQTMLTASLFSSLPQHLSAPLEAASFPHNLRFSENTIVYNPHSRKNKPPFLFLKSSEDYVP
jgi:hypothetical protein